jgi:hypothetical protein
MQGRVVWSLWNQQLAPLVRTGNLPGAQAISFGPMGEAIREHRRIIEQSYIRADGAHVSLPLTLQFIGKRSSQRRTTIKLFPR